jgi:hypothetical protein
VIWAGECNAGDGPKDKQDVQLFLAETLKKRHSRKPLSNRGQSTIFNQDGSLPGGDKMPEYSADL